MKLKTTMISIIAAAAAVATNSGKAQETITVPPGRTVIEVSPGDTVIQAAPPASTTVVTPSATIETRETIAEPAGTGRDWDFSMRDRFAYADEDEDLYRANEFTLDLAGAYGVGREKFNDTLDTNLRDGDWGASAGVNYFFTRHVGLGVDGFGLDNDGDDVVDAVSGSLILRLPIDVAHLAPYVFGGGGRTFEGSDTWTAHAGAGLELRLNPRTGIFVDGRHIFADRESVSDLALFRGGPETRILDWKTRKNAGSFPRRFFMEIDFEENYLPQTQGVMTITYEQIAKRAFEIWRQEGEPEGREQEHWLRAEAELRKEGLKLQKGKKISSKDPSLLRTPRGESL